MAFGPDRGRKLGRGLASLLGEPNRSSDEGSGSSAVATMDDSADSADAVAAVAVGNRSDSDSAGERVVKLAVELVRPNPFQPRSDFDDAGLEELADSLRSCGVINPLIVRRATDGSYELVSGERRLRAAKRAGLAAVPVVVRSVSDSESLEQALVENLQRRDLNPIEKAKALQDYIASRGLSVTEAEKRLGLSRSELSNHIRLLKLSAAVQEMVRRGALSYGHARALVAVDDPARQRELADRVGSESWSVRQLEDTIRQPATLAVAPPTPAAPAAETTALPVAADSPAPIAAAPAPTQPTAPAGVSAAATEPAAREPAPGEPAAREPAPGEPAAREPAAREPAATRTADAIAARGRQAQIRELEDELTTALGFRVTIKTNRKGQAGTLSIPFESLDEFDRIRAALCGGRA